MSSTNFDTISKELNNIFESIHYEEKPLSEWIEFFTLTIESGNNATLDDLIILRNFLVKLTNNYQLCSNIYIQFKILLDKLKNDKFNMTKKVQSDVLKKNDRIQIGKVKILASENNELLELETMVSDVEILKDFFEEQLLKIKVCTDNIKAAMSSMQSEAKIMTR
jgi:hypothetical protein